MRTARLVARIGALVAAGIALGSCGGAGSSSSDTDTRRQPLVQFLNGCPDSGSLDYYFDDTLLGASIAYPTVSPDFVEIEERLPEQNEGAYDIYARVPGTDEDVDRLIQVFNRETAQFVVALGVRTFGAEFEKRVRLSIVPVRRTSPAPGRSRLAVLNGYVSREGDEPTVIDFQTPGDNPIIAFRGIQFGESNIPEPEPGSDAIDPTVPAGTYTLQARLGGVTGELVLAQVNVTLVSGRSYVALVCGIEDDPNPERRPRIVIIEFTNQR